MNFINNKYLLKQFLWVLEEEKKFYKNYYNNECINIINHIYQVESIYKMIKFSSK